MSKFTTQASFDLLDDGKWRVRAPIIYHVGNIKSLDIISVPKGFITDFASIPQFFRNIIETVGKHGKGAVLHDYLYYTGERPRDEADEIFNEAMGVLGVSGWKRMIMYRAVRMFGWYAWNKHRERK